MIVGITGSIAMGKSLITKYIHDQGYIVIDSDNLVNQEYENKIVINEIIDHFGLQIITNNKIDRKKLGKIIFGDEKERSFLNDIIHPRVIQKIKELTKDNSQLFFVDIPLLFEAKLEYLVDKIIVIYTTYKTQLDRLVNRDNISNEYAKQKISSQMDIEHKLEKADYVVNNEYCIKNTYLQIDEIIRRLTDEI